MSQKAKSEIIQCRHFRWRLATRQGVWYADGRGNREHLGRNSLGTKNRANAMEKLGQLDLEMAVRLGRADAPPANRREHALLTLEDGRLIYEEFLGRPESAGGPSDTTKKRYRPVFDKLFEFLKIRGTSTWNQFDERTALAYLASLKAKHYEAATLHLEGVFITQVLKYLVRNGHLPADCLFSLKMRKPVGTSTHCWSAVEVEAMVAHCGQNPILHWLRDIIVALATTGMRIGELIAVRWSDVDLERGFIRIANDPTSTGVEGQSARRTKNRRDRAIPIHPDLRAVLNNLKGSRTGFVFRGPRGGKAKPDVVRIVFVRDVIESLKGRFPSPANGRGFEHGRLHSFRHFFYSLAANRGIPRAVLMTWVGHHDSHMAERYYHINDEESIQCMKKLSLMAGHKDNVVLELAT